MKNLNKEKMFESPQKVSITTDMIKNFKTVTCQCGSMLFESAIIIKKISPVISPTGKEELYPMEILVCKKCGKVPSELGLDDILPDEILAKNKIIK